MNTTKQTLDVDGLGAGPELDALVAERVMGWVWTERDYNRTVFGDPPPTYHVWWDTATDNVPDLCRTEKGNYNTGYTPPFSTDIAAAWQIVERMRHQQWEMTLTVNHYQTEPWDCRLFLMLDDVAPTKKSLGHGATAEFAICRAALKATR